RHRVIANLRGVMARAAEAADARLVELVVQPRHTRDIDDGVVEHSLAAGDGLLRGGGDGANCGGDAASGGEDGDGASRAGAATRRGVASSSGGATRCSIAARSGGAAPSSGATGAGPRSVEIEDLRRERYATRIEPDRVVDADEEVGELPRQRGRAAGGAVGG